jgi:hypothetical protein
MLRLLILTLTLLTHLAWSATPTTTNLRPSIRACIKALASGEHGTDAFDGLSEQWRAYLELDRNFNVSDRTPMKSAVKKVEPIYVYEVRPDDSRIQSHAIGGTNVLNFKSTKQRILSSTRLADQEPVAIYYKTLLQSHSTRMVWDPEHPKRDPVFIKPGLLEAAFYTSEILIEMFKEQPPEYFDILPEYELVNLDKQSYTVRSSTPSLGLGSAKLFPLHGLLGNESLIASFAAKMGMTKQQWLDHEFLPKFAKAMAEAQYKYGVLFSAHSQNTVLAVDPITGKIWKIIFRDLNDVHWDLLNLLSTNPAFKKFVERLRNEGLERFGLLNSQGMESDESSRRRARSPSRNIGDYAYQSIESCGLSQDPLLYVKIFLNNYVAEVAKITGIEITIDKALVEILNSNRRETQMQNLVALAIGDDRGTQALLRRIVKQLYSDVSQARVPVFKPEDFPKDQLNLYLRFQRAQDRSRVIWLVDIRDLEATGKERFAEKDNVIYLMGKNNKVEAMTLEL